MLIDCDTCQVRGPACADCVVTALIGTPVDLELPSVRPDDTVGWCRPDGSVDQMTARVEADRQPQAEGDQHRSIELDDIERAAVRALAAYGLVPPLRLVDSVTVSRAESAARDRRAG